MTQAPITTLLADYRADLARRLQNRTNESPEALLADLVPPLLTGIAAGGGITDLDLLGQANEGEIGRPDFSAKRGALTVGHVETKPPGAGADTRTYRGHDRDQWRRFQRLPNVLYTDGFEFSLYRSGERAAAIVRVPADGDLGSVAAEFADLTHWQVVAPRSLNDLARQLAPLCALLREAVAEKLADANSEVAQAAAEVREALFPDRTDAEVADAFAQVCSYSMLLARSRGAEDLGPAGVETALSHAHPVLGRAIRLLIDDRTGAELGWALDTIRALVEAVDFPALESKTGARTWLYFYETFLAEYDARLRNQFGVYYTPPAVISAQVTLLDELLRTRFDRPEGLASEGVTLLDPAVGTGSYPLQVLDTAAERVRDAQGAGAVGARLSALARNLFAFEVLVGPYAVAHLRLSEAIAAEGAAAPDDGVHVYLTDTLENPFADALDFGRQLEPLVEERRRALGVKSEQEILVCLGNPPYERLSAEDEQGEEKGGWVVHGEGGGAASLFETFLAPARGRTRFSHLASLYNLYVYFWRWALWKVFEAPNIDGSSNARPGVVSFITASSYLGGPGFLGMREHLRRSCDEIFVIDLGGEGHGARKEENVFAIQTPVAICMAVRSGQGDASAPARVSYCRIRGNRTQKLEVLSDIETLQDLTWEEAPTAWHAPLMPEPPEEWLAMPALADLFPFSVPGPMLNRTWPVAVTKESAEARWAELAQAPQNQKGQLFADSRFGRSSTTRSAGGYPPPASRERILDLDGSSPSPPVGRYGYRSFDRQWIVEDVRVMRTPSQALWWARGAGQLFLVALSTAPVASGPGCTVSAFVPDKHYFNGRGGRDITPLYRDPSGTPNIARGALTVLGEIFGSPVSAEELFAYAYAVLGNPGYVERFWDELETPGARVPVTRKADLFAEVAKLGREVINLHTFGERFPEFGRGVNPGTARIEGPIGRQMPDEFSFDEVEHALTVGSGKVSPVPPEVWEYEVSGLRPLQSWLGYRMREPAGRARSSGSPLDQIRPAEWTAELDTELLELLWTLERTLGFRERQDELLAKIMGGDLVAASELPEPSNEEREPPDLPSQGD